MYQTNALRIGIVFTLAVGLVACREGEQDRPLTHQPGVYTGKKDEKLDEQQLKQLRDRSRYQGRR